MTAESVLFSMHEKHLQLRILWATMNFSTAPISIIQTRRRIVKQISMMLDFQENIFPHIVSLHDTSDLSPWWPYPMLLLSFSFSLFPASFGTKYQPARDVQHNLDPPACTLDLFYVQCLFFFRAIAFPIRLLYTTLFMSFCSAVMEGFWMKCTATCFCKHVINGLGISAGIHREFTWIRWKARAL